MAVGVDKCVVVYVKKGAIVESEWIELLDSTKLRSLSAIETYKYLGFSHFFGHLKKILTNLLSGGNKVRAYNSWALLILIYSFGVFIWTLTELDKLDMNQGHLIYFFFLYDSLEITIMFHVTSKLDTVQSPLKLSHHTFIWSDWVFVPVSALISLKWW